ncbi:cell division protein FtsI/penicillin-binding protein 2 [Caldalkalibacillus uzonensis]|uniref:serine-type D-Ala-D-Ala carboxypeptidase n=1 Tax=Caldalkalibacillus uzonensis TaxID=353224 RepID=A0ABU0CWY6_9BACI|nr:penicillin-binding protein 2 [Caldalkalibacillus uzonensis]MDQ0339557.1 cell division protein FtsI/penicillin-binding protein 2 [Caldalkalibacillus uzonensis]
MKSVSFKRLVWLLLLMTGGLGLLLVRLAYVQLIDTEGFSKHQINLIKQAVGQRQQQLVLDSGRGEITDRYGKSLTGETAYVLVLFPLSQKNDNHDEQLQQLAGILKVPFEQLKAELDGLSEPRVYKQYGQMVYITESQAETINQLGIPGVLGLPYELRYPPDQRIASHLLGYLGENPDFVRQAFAEELAQGVLTENSKVGISGLERTFQPFLQGTGPTILAYYVDGRGFPLQGLGLKYMAQDNPFYPLVLETTLDADLQQQVEQVLDRRGVDQGAVVILDQETSEILALASRPHVVRDHPSHPSWRNIALNRYPPGSVFKIVIAAAALEEEAATLDSRYECPGVLAGTQFHCWKEDGHGSLTFAEAFYQSCNIVFGQLAIELGAETLERYARKLGLIDYNGWHADAVYHLSDFHQLDREEQGQVFAPDRPEHEKNDDLYLLRTGIGQLDVQLTPLAVANMMATITRGGLKYQVKAVNRITYQTGGSFYNFPAQRLPGPSISPYTAYQLQKLLAGVVQEGTAQALNDRPWQAAGKTGTAQANGGPFSAQAALNHHWFAGYYPANHPRYTITVLALNQPENTANLALAVFADVVDWLEGREARKAGTNG